MLYHHRTFARDGQEVHVQALIQALTEEGHAVEEVALVRKGGGLPSRPRRPLGNVKGAALRATLSLPRPLRELAEYAYTPVGAAMLTAAQRRFGADVVYERYAFGNAGGAIAARRLGLPLVLEVNSPLVEELTATRGVTFRSLARRVQRFVLGAADLVCVVSAELATILERSGARMERVLVLPNGVDVTRYHPFPGDEHRRILRARLALPSATGDGPEPVLVGFVGFFRRWHRLDLLLRAAAMVTTPHLQVAVIGDGEDRALLRRLARELGIAERIHFLGSRAAASLPDILAALDVAVLPSSTAYASPLKLVEYMAAGLAIAAPDQANIRELLTDGSSALLVEPGDCAALARALDRLAVDADLRRSLGQAARRTVEERELTWRANARRVIAAVTAATTGHG